MTFLWGIPALIVLAVFVIQVWRNAESSPIALVLRIFAIAVVMIVLLGLALIGWLFPLLPVIILVVPMMMGWVASRDRLEEIDVATGTSLQDDPDQPADPTEDTPPTPPPAQTGMTHQEALEIFGLSVNATPSDVQQAYHRLMTKIHPDVGGSTYLAAKINQARDILLK